MKDAVLLAAVGAAGLIFTSAVYSLVICFVYSHMKSLMGTAGVSLAILFVNVGLAAISDTVTQKLGVRVDFGLANVTLIKEVFGTNTSYPVRAILV